MAEKKLVSVKNTLDRYFNGAKKWDIIQVPENQLDFYLKRWFVKVEPIKAIVKNEDELTKKEIMEELEKLWVEYDKKAKKEELEKLLEQAKKEFEN